MYPADDTDVRLRFLLIQVRETIRRVADEVARARALHATLHELQGDIRKLSRRRDEQRERGSSAGRFEGESRRASHH
jgi:type II secretory pathway component PulJ